MTAHETYLPGIVKAIQFGLRCAPLPCELCGGLTVAWTESKIDPSYFYHKLVGGGEHRISTEYIQHLRMEPRP